MATKRKNKNMPVSKARNAYELLQEIRKLILEEPKRYDQEYTLTVGDGPDMPACGTVGCVAGWTVALKLPDRVAQYSYGGGVCIRAATILGLDYEQRSLLFDGGALGRTRPQTLRHAKRGAEHIKRFMEKHAKQLKAKKV